MAKVSQELQAVVKKNPGIKEVYFNENGQHFFSVHQIEVHEVDESGFSTKILNVTSLPGAKKAAVKIIVDRKKGKVIDKYVNVEYVPVHHKMSRNDVLKATPAKSNQSEEAKLSILLQASEIMKDQDNIELLKKLK